MLGRMERKAYEYLVPFSESMAGADPGFSNRGEGKICVCSAHAEGKVPYGLISVYVVCVCMCMWCVCVCVF